MSRTLMCNWGLPTGARRTAATQAHLRARVHAMIDAELALLDPADTTRVVLTPRLRSTVVDIVANTLLQCWAADEARATA